MLLLQVKLISNLRILLMKQINAKAIVRGDAKGELLIFKNSFSFLGDVDMDSSKIVVKGHEHEGEKIDGKILFLPDSKGSSGGCVVLSVLGRENIAPSGIIIKKMADANLVEGAILSSVPVVCLPEEDVEAHFKNGDMIHIDGGKGSMYKE